MSRGVILDADPVRITIERGLVAKRLLIATNGSAAADAAVEAGLEVAEAMRAKVTFLHAASPLAEQLFAEYPVDGLSLDVIVARDAVLRAAVQRARQMKVDHEVKVLADEGDTADLAASIAGVAHGIGASMIIVGSRGRGAAAGAVLGSVSHNLIKYATIPVLVVHAQLPSPA